MCGEILKSPNAETAVQWAIAYAKSFEDNDDYQRFDNPLPDDRMRRAIATEFINDYVPQTQRSAALQLLKNQPDPLDTAVRYWNTVVDQGGSFAHALSIIGTKVHDTYDNYETHRRNVQTAKLSAD
jgi:hypothetical protein